MKNLIALIFILFIGTNDPSSQKINLTPAKGFDEIKIGDSMEAVQEKLGFGKRKSYDRYVADELFDRNPEKTLECQIGFDHYIKYEYLLTLPISFIFFKNDIVVQIKSTSFPEYYRALSEDVIIGKEKMAYWMETEEMRAEMGDEEFHVNEEYLILDNYHYFTQGISFSAREDLVRMVHVYEPIPSENISKLSNELKK